MGYQWIEDDTHETSPSLEETKAKIREIFRHHRKIPAKLKDRAAFEKEGRE